MKQNRKILSFLSVILFFMVIIVMAAYKKDVSLRDILDIGSENKEIAVDYSDEYKKWLELSEEERSSCVDPKMYDYGDTNPLSTNISSTLNLNANDFESKFSLKNLIPENLVFLSQGSTSLCWGFAALRTLETNLALTDYYNGVNATVYDFSQRHMDYATSRYFIDGTNKLGYYRDVGSGGYDNMVYAYFTNGMGAIPEEEMPFKNNKNQLYLSSIQNKIVATRVYDIDRYSYSSLNDEGMLAIKNHIKNYGAVSTANYYRSSAINWSTCAAYHTKNSLTHGVAIIGWDDNYSKTNFKSSQRPSKDGAWIAINSVSSCPILYISYYDSVVNDDLYGVSKATTNVNYDNIYQYDWYGPSQMYYVSSSKLFLGNIYERDTDEVEYLTDVAIHAAETYKVKVYVNPNGSSMDKDELQQVKLKDGDYEIIGHGYHTLELEKPIELSGDKFVVVLEIESDGTRTYYYNETKLSSSGIYRFVTNSGNTYYSKYDVLEDSSKWTKQDSDNTIKAFTVKGIKKITLKSNPNKTTYLEGEDFDKTGMIIEVTYSNGKTEEVTDYVMSNNTNLKVNQKNIQVTYRNGTLNVPVIVEKNTVSSIYVSSIPNKIKYIEGENFDKTGMEVTAIYRSGKKEKITDYELINATNLDMGQTYVTISYNGKYVNQPISVSLKQIQDISIKIMPQKLEYGLNIEQLDLTGGVLEVRYDNGTVEDILMTDGSVIATGFNNSQEGQNVVTLTYMKKSVQITVNIIKKDGGVNTNFKSAVCDIEEIKILNSGSSENSYAEMKIEVNEITRDMTNDSFEYYYYLSSEDHVNFIDNWTKISEEQLESNKLSFTIDTKNIENVNELKNYETLNLYIKEVATKNKINDETAVRLVLVVSEDSSNYSNKNKSKVGVIVIVGVILLVIGLAVFMYFRKLKSNNKI